MKASCLSDTDNLCEAYRNLVSFLGDWEAINRNGTSAAVDVRHRPVGTSLLYDNTTLTSAWIETTHSNTTEQHERFNRIINNVTLAMPHPSVYDAATNPVNKILQPNDLSGVGEYGIRASVVSPALNVMCVNMSPEELEPLVYTEWPIGKVLYDDTTVPGQRTGKPDWEKYVPGVSETEWLNRTSVDGIFRWGEDYGRRPPVFPLVSDLGEQIEEERADSNRQYPADYNMITNTSVESDAIYILTKSASIADYTLCEMRSWVSPNCSTHFNISGTAGAHMQVHCDDPDDTDSYTNVHTEVTESTPVTDWRARNPQHPLLIVTYLPLSLCRILRINGVCQWTSTAEPKTTTPPTPAFLPNSSSKSHSSTPSSLR